MTTFALEPYLRVTVRSFMRYENAEEFARAMTSHIPRGAGRAGNVFWANGIIFRHSNYIPTESISQQYLRRHVPIDHIDYALMPKYQNEINTDGIIVTILNVTPHTLFNPLTKWISEKVEKRR